MEVTQYEGEGLKTLVPRVVGQTAEAEQKKQTEKTEWNESNFFDELRNRHSEELARRVRDMYDLAVEEGCSIDWRAGDSLGGFFVDVGNHRLFEFRVNGKLWTDSRYFADFVREEDWERLLAQAERLGLEFPEDPSERTHPRRFLEGVGEEWWDRFELFFEWAREKARPNPA